MTFMLKKPSELVKNKPTPVDYIHTAPNGKDIAVFCPDCGAEIEFRNEWPIDIPITCGSILEDLDICKCRIILNNDTPIEP